MTPSSILENPSVDDMGIPVIQMSSSASLSRNEKSIADELVSALKTIGFATIVGHGIDPSVVENAHRGCKAFFDLEETTKLKYGYKGHASNRGYIALGNESHQDFVVSDRKEIFDIGKEGEPGFATPWPDELLDSKTGFRQDMLMYMDCFDALFLRLMRLIAIGLELPDENFFVDRCNERHVNLRLLHYPSVVRKKEDARELLVRGARHTDFGTLTLLTQDRIGGLRVQRLDGSWIFVPPPTDGGIVINVGDMLQRWTNDVLRATPHQVVELRRNDNDDSESYTVPDRYSIAFFCNANKEVIIEPLVGLSDEPIKYEPVKSHDYLIGRLSATISN